MLRRSTLLRCGERDCRRKVHKKLSLKQCLKLRNSFKTDHCEKITTKHLFEFISDYIGFNEGSKSCHKMYVKEKSDRNDCGTETIHISPYVGKAKMRLGGNSSF